MAEKPLDDERRRSDTAAEPQSASPGVRARRRKLAFLAAGCLASVFMGGLAWYVLAGRFVAAPVTIQNAFAELSENRYAEARAAAELIRTRAGLTTNDLAGALFVLGTATCREADESWKDPRPQYLLASRWLEEARDYGWPRGHEAEGLFLLGKSLYGSGQIAACMPVLLDALVVCKSERTRTEIHGLLAGAYLYAATPQWEKAFEENTKYLADRFLSAPERYIGLLVQARILLGMDRIAECLASLKEIPADSKQGPEAVIMQGRVLIRQAEQIQRKAGAEAQSQALARQKYEEAIKALQAAQGRDTLGTQATRKAMYLIGMCYAGLGENRAAEAQLASVRKLFPNTPESLAADLQIAEIHRQLDRDKEALAAYRRVVQAAGDPKHYANPWIPLDWLRGALRKGVDHYLRARNYRAGQELARSLSPLFPRTQALELQADLHHRWGRSLLEEAQRLPFSQAEQRRREGRLQLRYAGRAYVRLARLHLTTRQYPEDLWNAAQDYLDGQAYASAAGVLREYLKNEAGERRPRSLVAMGEAMLALGKPDDAIANFRECIEVHPRHAASFRARLLAADAYLEKGDLKQAERTLRGNLDGESLTPASEEWRDSLFALGHLLLCTGRYEEAIERLEEAVNRYPKAPQILEAQYWTAQAYRRWAGEEAAALRKDLGEDAPVEESRKVRGLLAGALRDYQRVQEALDARRHETELTPGEQALLRNCTFAVGDMHFDLGEFREAIKSYSTITNRYQDRPEVLEAYVQIAAAYRRLREPQQACSALEQAKLVLERMNKDADFSATTIYSRQEWADLLSSLTRS